MKNKFNLTINFKVVLHFFLINNIKMKKTQFCKILVWLFLLHFIVGQDPFSLLGIPSLNPSAIFNDDYQNPNSYKKMNNAHPKEIPVLKSLEDLPAFLRSANLSEKEGLCIISRFLLSDDFLLKKYGAVFDQTGFDGLMSNEAVYPVGSKERLSQRARSAAKLYYKNTYEGEEYEAYGAEEVSRPGMDNGWKMFNVLMVGRSSVKDHMFLRACIPDDEMYPPIVNQADGDCADKV
jgi:hypothetical protein